MQESALPYFKNIYLFSPIIQERRSPRADKSLERRPKINESGGAAALI